MVSEEKYHLINDYLKGELKGRALDSFKTELNKSSELQEAVKLQASIIKGLEAAREKELKTYLQENLSAKPHYKLGSTLRIALASAAAIALLVVAFVTFQKNISTSEPEITKEQTPQKLKKQESTDLNKDTSNNVLEIDTQTLAIEDVELPIPETSDEPISGEDLLDTESNDEETETASDVADKQPIEKDPTDKTEAPVDIASSEVGTPDNPLKDELMGSNRFAVNTLVTLIEEESLEVEPRKKAENRYENKDIVYKNADGNISPRSIKVEYWKPVIKSKAYLYDGKTLKLYGIENQAPLEFKELDNRLYVELNKKHYFLEKNNNQNRLVEVTNPTLLRVLNE